MRQMTVTLSSSGMKPETASTRMSVMSRYSEEPTTIPALFISGEQVCCGLSSRHSLNVVRVGGESRSAGTWWDEQGSDG